MKLRRWFLPHEPDVLGLLAQQLAVIREGMEAFATWAGGDASAEAIVRDCEHRADAIRRDLHSALRDAFVTPIEPEDLYALSRDSDEVLNQAKDAVRESEVMACAPDAALGEMAEMLAQATRQLEEAISHLGARSELASDAANAAVKSDRRVEHIYRIAMAALLETDDLREVTARRELYRRCSRMGETVVDVAERIQYAVVKES
jgi:uncharacterized protein Yka (UPF0111/DUF47 family)